MTTLPTFADVVDAARVLQGHAVRTPLIESPALNERLGGRVLIKAENLQVIGAFMMLAFVFIFFPRARVSYRRIREVLTGDIAIGNPVENINGATAEIVLTQDATGGRTIAWPSNEKYAGGSAPSDTTANTRTIVTLVNLDGSRWYEKSRTVAVPNL